MMYTLHLLWIVPLAASVGFCICALFVAASLPMPKPDPKATP